MELISRSPQDPSDVIVRVEEANRAAVNAIVEHARTAQREWAALAAPARAAALVNAAERLAQASDELTELGIREIGKPRVEMSGELARAVAIVRYYAQQVLDPDGVTFPSPDGRSALFARRYPYGVAGLITPWNFPVAIPLWKVVPALAYGNAAVLKPAPQSLGIALRVHEILAPLFPAGLFGVVAGDAEAGQALVEAVDLVSFTGSSAVGKLIIEAGAKRGIPVQTEMGGQNPSIVLPDADFARAADTIAGASMGYAGQKCTATSRVIVIEHGDAFTDALVAAIEKLPLGDPADASTIVGPVIEDPARQAVLEASAVALRAGGRVLTGGHAPASEGYFVEPTLIAGLGPNDALAQEEVFGPIAVLLRAKDVDEAIAIANGVRYGLAAALFTQDLDSALVLSTRLSTGIVKINAPTSGVEFYAPFGGNHDSSYGPRELGKAARDFYTWSQTVTIAPARS